MHKLLSNAINLDGTVFDFRTVVGSLEKKIWLNRDKPGLVDFGTVFIVPDACPDVFLEHFLKENEGLPLFVAPSTWRMPQLLKALGAFDSTGDARKNGWDKEIQTGFDEHAVRIAKIKGCISTFKLPLKGHEVAQAVKLNNGKVIFGHEDLENGEWFHAPLKHWLFRNHQTTDATVVFECDAPSITQADEMFENADLKFEIRKGDKVVKTVSSIDGVEKLPFIGCSCE